MAFNYYTVQPGDNLSTIGRQMGVPWTLIAKVNRLSDPNHIQPNDVLMIPAQTSEEDRLRVDAAKAAPAGEAVRAQRPSQTPQSVGFDVVERPRPTEPSNPLPQRAKDLLENNRPGVSLYGQDTGSIRNIQPETKPYPPGPSQVTYPSFWADFLDKELPTAMQGATGPGAAFFRAAAKLKDFAGYPYAEPNAARADFYRKAGRSGVDLSQDPNYGQVFSKDNSSVKPEAYSGPELSAEPTAMDIGLQFASRILKDALGFPSPMPRSPAQLEVGAQAGKGQLLRREGAANAGAADPYAGPGSSYAKGTTATKSPSGPENPLAKAIQAGMDKHLRARGEQLAGDLIDLTSARNRRGMSDSQKYNHALDQQHLDKIVHGLLAKPVGSWTDEDISLVKQLLGPSE